MGLPEERGEAEGAASAAGPMFQLAWVFYFILAVAGVLWIGLREGALGLALFVDPDHWARDLGLGAFAGAVLLGAWTAAGRIFPVVRSLERRLRAVVGPMSRSDAVGIALLSGFAEELFFRGAVQGSLGWPAATLLFALLHSGRERIFWLWTIFAAVAGGVFAGLTIATGNLTAAIVAHGLVNAVNLPRIAGAPSDD